MFRKQDSAAVRRRQKACRGSQRAQFGVDGEADQTAGIAVEADKPSAVGGEVKVPGVPPAAGDLLHKVGETAVQTEHGEQVGLPGGDIEKALVPGEAEGRRRSAGGGGNGVLQREVSAVDPVEKELIAALGDQKEPPSVPVKDAVPGPGAGRETEGAGRGVVPGPVEHADLVQLQAGDEDQIAVGNDLMTPRVFAHLQPAQQLERGVAEDRHRTIVIVG